MANTKKYKEERYVAVDMYSLELSSSSPDILYTGKTEADVVSKMERDAKDDDSLRDREIGIFKLSKVIEIKQSEVNTKTLLKIDTEVVDN